MNESLKSRPALAVGGAVILLAIGCGKEQTDSYLVPKEPARAVAPAAPPPAHGKGMVTSARPSWDAPPGWEEKPATGMRVATFAVAGVEGRAAEIVVIPLPGHAGVELDSVNMWRGELGMNNLSEAALESAAEHVQVGPFEGHLYDIQPKEGEGKSGARTIGTILSHGQTSWYFKLSGDAALVGEQKEPFIGFLKTIEFDQGGRPPAMTASSPSASSSPSGGSGEGKPTWQVPGGWTEQPGSGMRVATFVVEGAGGTADLSVIKLAGDAGGMLANVNRWRGQIGLGPVSADQLAETVTTLDMNGTEATLVDLTSGDGQTRVLGAVVPHRGATWFYKMTGPAALVADEKEKFAAFMKSVKHP